MKKVFGFLFALVVVMSMALVPAVSAQDKDIVDTAL